MGDSGRWSVAGGSSVSRGNRSEISLCCKLQWKGMVHRDELISLLSIGFTPAYRLQSAALSSCCPLILSLQPGYAGRLTTGQGAMWMTRSVVEPRRT